MLAGDGLPVVQGVFCFSLLQGNLPFFPYTVVDALVRI